MKTPLKTLLLLLVACGACGAAVIDAARAQSCYRSVGVGETYYRFGEGPAAQCNVDGVWGSSFIGPVRNATFSTNASIRKTYKQATRDAKRAYDDGVRCIEKLLGNEDIDRALADDHLYHLKTEYEDTADSWEDWYEEFYGNMCN
ncbi:MAG: hypothetical protein OXS28_15250 [Gammaproteobacteria bacterium]|nr:hypothetical protein [Gammaproteobacteria bacterium]